MIYARQVIWIDNECLCYKPVYFEFFDITSLITAAKLRNFYWMDFKAFGLTHEQLSRKLLDEAKVGFNDGKAFGTAGDNCMRINLACPRATVTEALCRLQKVFHQ